MKRILILFLCALMLCTAVAHAENMLVVNCREWVSLRSGPSTESERITKIPLGSVVWDCVEAEEGWIYGTYCGMSGYISADYLSTDAASDALYYTFDGVTIFGNYSYTSNSESYEIYAFSENGDALWQYTAYCSFSTELSMVDAFIAGTEDEPVVMAYSADRGLSALDMYTGKVLWTLTTEEISLGGSITHAVDADGTMYIAGYYGPDPVAISADGVVLWESDLNDGYIWPDKIEIDGETLRCHFGMCDIGEVSAWVYLVKADGRFAGVEYEP